MKECPRCGERKPVEDFAWKRKDRGQRQTYCRGCQARYNRSHYQANKSAYVARAATRKHKLRAERTAFLLDYFATHPCVDCGETDPVVLEFDHLGGKLFDISERLPWGRWESILAEIDKCEVVCANCHRRRTKRQQNAARILLAER